MKTTSHSNTAAINHPHNDSSKKQLRRLRLLIKRGLFNSLPDNNMVCRRATSVEELRDAYQLVYEIYLDQKYILPNKSKMRVRAFEASPDTATFVSRNRDKTLGVFSCIMDSPELKLPADKVFKPELKLLRDSGATLCEFSNQVILPEYRSSSVVTELMRTMFAHIWFHNITDAVCAITPTQIEFYKLLGFTQLSDIKSYSDVVYDPVVLMRMPDVQNIWAKPVSAEMELEEFRYQFFTATNPYISAVPFWDAMADRLFTNTSSMNALFAECLPEFEQLSFAERTVIAASTGLKISMSDASGQSYSENLA